MAREAIPSTIDRMAVGLSGLCVLHCALSVALVAMLSTSATFMTDPLIHRMGLAGAVILAAVALRQGYLAHRALLPVFAGLAGLVLMVLGLVVPHGWPEVATTAAGVSVLAVAHLMNARTRA